MYTLSKSDVAIVGGGTDPCPKGGSCPIDTPQSEVGKTIDDVARGVKKLAGEIVDVAKMLWNKL